MSLLNVKNLKKYYSAGLIKKRYSVKALDGVSFDVVPGEIFGVIGESGCGKTTLGLVLSRLERETSGEITFKGSKLSGTLKLDPETRRQIQIIFQNPYESFDPRLRIEQSLLLPMRINHICDSDAERREKILGYMKDAGFEPPDAFLNRYSHELSGGQLQRISIIRAMLLKPTFFGGR
jgi:peptide/nickel transport system ATP-binding protein